MFTNVRRSLNAHKEKGICIYFRCCLVRIHSYSLFDSYVNKEQSFVSNDLQNHLSILPPNFCANVIVSTYDFSGGSFVIDDVYNVTKTGCIFSQSEVAKAKRVFMSVDPEKYGKVE